MNKFLESLGNFVTEHPFIAGWAFVSIVEAVCKRNMSVVNVYTTEELTK